MEEDQISFETAKLLKTAGMNLYIGKYYTGDGSKGMLSTSAFNHMISIGYGDTIYPCFPQSLVNKWFREKYRIHILIDFRFKNESVDWYYRIYDITTGELMTHSDNYYNDYKDANEFAIREAIKYI